MRLLQSIKREHLPAEDRIKFIRGRCAKPEIQLSTKRSKKYESLSQRILSTPGSTHLAAEWTDCGGCKHNRVQIY